MMVRACDEYKVFFIKNPFLQVDLDLGPLCSDVKELLQHIVSS